MKFNPRKVAAAFAFQVGFALIGVGIMMLGFSLGPWVFIVAGAAGILAASFAWGKEP